MQVLQHKKSPQNLASFTKHNIKIYLNLSSFYFRERVQQQLFC